MAGKQIGIVHPPLEPLASGGNIYNRNLLQSAKRGGWPLQSLAWQAGAWCADDFVILVWDSLLLDHVARLGGERLGLLLHYLPSSDPTLDRESRFAACALEDRAAAKADFAIATGRHVAAVAAGRWPRIPVFVCEPGVGEMFQPARGRGADGTVRLLTVAGLTPAKGHEPLLRILQGLRHLPWHWHIVGGCAAGCEMEQQLREQATRAGLIDRIHFRGVLRQDEVAAVMAECDVLVAPSAFESYAMAVAEAAAVGLPVLSYRVGAAEQLIGHGATGFLVARGDWGSFGRYLETLLQDGLLRASLRENLRDAPVRGWDTSLTDFRAACEAMLR